MWSILRQTPHFPDRTCSPIDAVETTMNGTAGSGVYLYEDIHMMLCITVETDDQRVILMVQTGDIGVAR